ncbi:uncharacterized protein LOC128958817 isoform X2 [Oppia nitens]|uniref:uncharacterized protein LOC128958817 isoform X2 n=1 Tax=Oppia nitens TaxID=1686743 RepID=UPI0023DC2D16|nr:uncharacterized protein LOC128958817 isoform X2 [Oppia nitens]
MPFTLNALLDLSARSKVMSNWTSSLVDSESPDVVDQQMKSTHKSSHNRLNRRSICDSPIKDNNSLKVLSNNNSRHLTKTDDSHELTKIKNKSIVDQNINHSLHEPNEETKSEILRKLRKHRFSANYYSNNGAPEVSSKVISNDNNDSKSANKVIDKQITNEMIEIKDNLSANTRVDQIIANEEQSDDIECCFVNNCNQKVSTFHLFDNKFCSSRCAVYQWTLDFHKTFGQTNIG